MESSKKVFVTSESLHGDNKVICFLVGMMHIAIETKHDYEYVVANIEALQSFAVNCSVGMSEVGENPSEYADPIYRHHGKTLNLQGDEAIMEIIRMIKKLKSEEYEFVRWV